MKRNPLSSEKGFTLLAALFLLMIMGIMLGMIGETWSMIMRRDREEELLFRGKQIKDAIRRYNEVSGQPVTSLADLRSLYEGDPRFLERRRYLRRNYLDPITGKEWNFIKNPARGIVGVVSSSDLKPLKKANFPEEFKEFEGKDKYSTWQFLYLPQGGAQPVGAAGTTSGPGRRGL